MAKYIKSSFDEEFSQFCEYVHEVLPINYTDAFIHAHRVGSEKYSYVIFYCAENQYHCYTPRYSFVSSRILSRYSLYGDLPVYTRKICAKDSLLNFD